MKRMKGWIVRDKDGRLITCIRGDEPILKVPPEMVKRWLARIASEEGLKAFEAGIHLTRNWAFGKNRFKKRINKWFGKRIEKYVQVSSIPCDLYVETPLFLLKQGGWNL